MRLLVAAGVATVALVAAGLALALTPTHQALIDTTVRYLQERQDTSGGFAEPGARPSQGFSAWVALALASAGINPQDQARCGKSAFEYLEEHFHEGLEEELAWPQIAVTSFERELLVVDASGTDPHHFAGYDLVAEILGRQLEDGSFPYTPDGQNGESNDTIFAILALGPVHEPAVQEAIASAREWVVSAQLEDGGWYYSGSSPHSEVDMTGAALQALVAAGAPTEEVALTAYEEAIEKGGAYLKSSQLSDGGFPALPVGELESNVASTAWAVQAIWALGENPEAWTAGPEGREPLDYMESMQQPDGHIRWRASSDMNGIWMTAYVTPAFDGHPLPIPAAPRNDPQAVRGEASACLEPGEDGGGGPDPSEEGVIAGGGGHRAPLFSRPKAQSEGKTPGGARLVQGQSLHARDHSSSRRGENTEQARGSETEEPKPASEADQETPVVSHDATTGAAAGAGAGGDGDGSGGPGAKVGPITTEGKPPAARTTTGEEVSGVVIGSPEGKDGALALGAPGLRAAGGGRGGGGGVAIAIAVGIALAALGGAAWERRRWVTV